MSHYIVKSAAACMPASCWGRYARVAVLEIEDGVEDVAMISPRARGVLRVVQTWECLHVGRTERCALARALREAECMADELNATPPCYPMAGSHD